MTGALCENKINECSTVSPCLNGGACDFGSGLNCTGDPDFVVVGCQQEFDARAAGVYQNGATCVDNGAGYKCNCPDGFSGRHCEQDVVECVPGACPLSATCIDLIDDFYCRCPFNLTGDDCRKFVQTDYDFFFSDETRRASASLVIPFALGSSSLTLALWVQFTHRGDIGNIATVDSPSMTLATRSVRPSRN